MPYVQKDFVLKDLLTDVAITSPFVALAMYVNFLLVQKVNLGYPNKKDWRKRIAIEFVAAIFFAFLLVFVLAIPYALIQGKSIQSPNTWLLDIPTYFMVFFNVIVIWGIDAVYQFRNNYQQQLEIANLKKENILYQHKRLKDQINPHFLFNNLNVLVSLIHLDSNRAEAFTKKLAKVYRYVLTNDESDLIELNEELTFIHAYIDLLKERFDKGMDIRINIQENDLHKLIIPLTLQGLIENAIKHNIASDQQPLQIDIYTEDDRLIVRNNLQKRSYSDNSTGLGLKSMMERYSMFYGCIVSVNESLKEFIVSVPLIR